MSNKTDSKKSKEPSKAKTAKETESPKPKPKTDQPVGANVACAAAFPYQAKKKS